MKLFCRPLFLMLIGVGLLAAVQPVGGQHLSPQRGNASYYHDRFHGRRMSNGELYNKDSMTCAHLRYPLGTWLHVRNLSNGKSVDVRVTDRGPYTRKFVIDLSRAAARELDIIKYGYRQVEITPFVPGRVPYKWEASQERAELDLGYSSDRPGDPPFWQDDSVCSIVYRRLLELTDSLRAVSERADSLKLDSVRRDSAAGRMLIAPVSSR